MPISLFAPNSPIGSLIGQAAPAYAPPPAPTFGSFTPVYERNAPMKLPSTFGPTMDQAALQSDFAAPITTTPGVPSKIGFSSGESKDGAATTGYGPLADASIARTIGGTTTATGGGTSASLGGDWAGVDQWTNDINAAAAATGVDANDLKGIMKLESNGDPGAQGAPGVGGLMQVNSSVWGSGPWQTDNAANILKGAQIYKSYLDQYGGDKTMALRAYHGFGSDGYTTDVQYASTVMANIGQLNASGGGGSTGTSAGLQGMFGAQASVPDWGAFNVASSNGLYGYGTEYGLNGVNHTGEDIPLAYGSPMTVPFSGRVVCAGTGVGDGTDSCAAFQDTIGGGAGRLEIMSDDGNTILIFGHASRAAVGAGTHINAGSLIGWSGGENSEHVHLEARVRDASTPSGWRIVDPSTVIGSGGLPSSVSSRFANIGQNIGGNPLRDFLERQR